MTKFTLMAPMRRDNGQHPFDFVGAHREVHDLRVESTWRTKMGHIVLLVLAAIPIVIFAVSTVSEISR
ncbi:MAG: hypothetical protein G01um101456_124 [Parcubacteria group bacterium Gr01-1014_56]|nr:MAG: hypothetical protein G01um101456_124 [Parcubacteria group bacterium Gr01-1014_56]